MNKIVKKAVGIVLSSIFLLSACAETYTPVVDMKGVDGQKYQQDLYECRQYASQIDIVGSVSADSALAAAGGVATNESLGKLSNNPGTSASLGTDQNGFSHSNGAQNGPRQITIINNCLMGRGYRILR